MGVNWEEIGQVIKAARQARRPVMRQADLAQLLGMQQSSVSRIERGTPSSIPTIQAICQILGLEMDLTVHDPDHIEKAVAMPPEMIGMVGTLNAMPPDERRVIVEVLNLLPEMDQDLRKGAMLQFRLWIQSHNLSSKQSQNAG